MTDDFGFRGFFELRTPQDLLKKLRHDHQRLTTNSIDWYAAFDFFVTANHMVDWVSASATHQKQQENRRSQTVRRICKHLADGAKHFLLSREHHGVAGTEKTDGPFGSGFDPRAFNVGQLIVTLEPAEAVELGRERIAVLDLAVIVLDYWEGRIGRD